MSPLLRKWAVAAAVAASLLGAAAPSIAAARPLPPRPVFRPGPVRPGPVFRPMAPAIRRFCRFSPRC
ncbi:MAG: hypothetical protein PHS73_01175 [Candidatus Peribacteraceae bacterium]|nr:hypothetical protein [Candidatus Peribacteraceae bacterium]